MRIWPVVACCAILSFPAFAEPAESVLSAAETQKAGFLKTLEQLVNLDSGSDDGPGLAKVQDVLVQRLRDSIVPRLYLSVRMIQTLCE